MNNKLNYVPGILLACFVLAACGPNYEAVKDEVRQKLDQGNFREAVSLVDELGKSGNPDAELYLLRGVGHYQLEAFSSARNDFEKSVSLDSADYRAFFNLGNVARQQNNPEEAIKHYSRALELDSTHYDIWLNRALSRFNTGDMLAALQDFSRAAEVADNPDKNIFFYRGKVNFRLEDLQAAREDFLRVTEIDPDFGEAWHSLALVNIIMEGSASQATCQYLAVSDSLGFAPASELLKTYCQQ